MISKSWELETAVNLLNFILWTQIKIKWDKIEYNLIHVYRPTYYDI